MLLNSVLTTNRYIATTHRTSSMFASMFFAILDSESGRLVYINGGHEQPIIFRAEGSMEMLPTTGPVLGLFAAASFTVQETRLGIGDLLLSYTDGVTEAKNLQGQLYSEENLLKNADPQIKDPQAFVEDVLQNVRSHCGRADQFDDITMLALRYSG
ncbi:MAG: PP2C family protein-serine/threonine phosphatase, partial [Gammaproteobacteria bacterium]